MNIITARFIKNAKTIFSALCFILILFSISSCTKPAEKHQEKALLSGVWSFNISPDKSNVDTTLVKGIRGSEEEEYPAIIDEVYLYEDASGVITGDHGVLRFNGNRSGNEVTLEVYNNPEGHFDPGMSLEKLVHISTMTMTINEFGNMKGHGIYLENPDYEGAQDESYFVSASKRGDITNASGALKEGNEDVLNTLCDVSASISSFLISYLSDGAFRPIGNCYLEKDGGGYYIYGRFAPGSSLPVYTQTVYYPFEWSWCKVRRYGFDINLRGNIRGIEALKWAIAHQAPSDDFYIRLGYSSLEELNNLIDDFKNKYGEFAISIAYSLRTGNLSIYVNHSKGDDNGAKNHSLVFKMASALGPHVTKIYYFSGKNIHDSWYLRRSELGVCNSKLLFCYILGTNQVEYN